MVYLIAFMFAGLLLAAAIAIFVCGHLYGELKVKNKWIVDQKRAERRLNAVLELWQSKAIERSGLGPLRKRETPQTDPKPSRNIVAPSQAIARQREFDDQQPRIRKVPEKIPPTVATGFLKDAANGRNS